MPELLVTPATQTPVSLDEAKLFLRVTHNSEDSEITAAIEDATKYCEDRLGQQFLTAEWLLALPRFPHCILLPRPPLQAVDEISYVDTNGTTQVLDPAEYQVDAVSRQGRIVPARLKFWPQDVDYETVNAVQVKFTAGYQTPEEVKQQIPQAVRAIKLLVSEWYQTREPIASIAGSTVDALLATVWHGEYRS